MQGYKDWRWSVTDLLQSDFNRNAGGSHEHWLGCVFWGADSLKEIFLEDILHVCDGSMPPVSINGNTSPFYIEVIQDSMEVGAVSHQYKELYFWVGKRGMKTIET